MQSKIKLVSETKFGSSYESLSCPSFKDSINKLRNIKIFNCIDHSVIATLQ